MAKRQAILILGMHRSGTSALTRVLNLCGAALPDDVLPPNASNESGYWEPTAVVTFHEQLLASAGSAWNDLREFPTEWLESVEGHSAIDRLASVVRAQFADEPLIAIKDPRTCRLVPLWLEALDRLSIQPLVVLMVRHPLEVAASLRIRDGLSVPATCLMWLQHVLAAEADTRACPRVVVAYEQLITDWARVVDRIESRLGVRLTEERAPGTPVAEALSQFLTPSLRHTRHAREDLDQHPDVTSWVRTVYDWHLEAAVNEPPPSDALDRVRRELRDAATTFEPLLRDHEARIAVGDQRARQLEDKVAALETARQQREAEWLIQQAQWEQRQTEWEERARRLESDLADALQRASLLRDRITVIERDPFWRLRTWLARQRARLSGR